MTIWFITGCSSGLCHALAKTVVEAGFNAVATAPDVSQLNGLASDYPKTAPPFLALDVTDRAAVKRAVVRAGERFGRIDDLVNNVRYSYRAAVGTGKATPSPACLRPPSLDPSH